MTATNSSNSITPLLAQKGNILIIVPPFAFVNCPSLGSHVLQAYARKEGFEVDIIYANMHFAKNIGYYAKILSWSKESLMGERLFAATAYGVPPLGHDIGNKSENNLPEWIKVKPLKKERKGYNASIMEVPVLREVESKIDGWVEEVATVVANENYQIVGCTSMFEQTAASIALLNRIKQKCPDIITIMGGPNCENEMASGIASLTNKIDYIFSGESEQTFVDFLQKFSKGEKPKERIVYGRPLQHMDILPTPIFEQYYQQLEYYLPKVAANAPIELTYETSRGCWWGQKHHCTFCGLNGEGIGFREKSSAKVIQELKDILAKHPYSPQLIQMTDNIMPYTFFRTLLPSLTELTANSPSLRIYYEQKSNLSLTQVIELVQAGITHIQPGIEALSTSLLKRMDKGVSAAKNIALLRYAYAMGMSLDWNLLWGFPGDQEYEYEETLALLPLIHHLEPPIGAHHLRIDRFSPYFEHAERYGITNLKPLASYSSFLPEHVDTHKVAYHFRGDYESFSHLKPPVIDKIRAEIIAWHKDWDEEANTLNLFFGKVKLKERPILKVVQEEDDRFTLHDTRGLLGTETQYNITLEQAKVALISQRYTTPSPAIEWALKHKIGVIVDSKQYVPLAIAEPELLLRFEKKAHPTKRKQPKFKEVIPLVAS